MAIAIVTMLNLVLAVTMDPAVAESNRLLTAKRMPKRPDGTAASRMAVFAASGASRPGVDKAFIRP
jgi:hypothetical protein